MGIQIGTRHSMPAERYTSVLFSGMAACTHAGCPRWFIILTIVLAVRFRLMKESTFTLSRLPDGKSCGIFPGRSKPADGARMSSSRFHGPEATGRPKIGMRSRRNGRQNGSIAFSLRPERCRSYPIENPVIDRQRSAVLRTRIPNHWVSTSLSEASSGAVRVMIPLGSNTVTFISLKMSLPRYGPSTFQLSVRTASSHRNVTCRSWPAL